MTEKPRLGFWQMFNMSFGFLGIQFGWGLQLANMSAICARLGARPDEVPLLWLAAPVTGLVVQPIIGALSGRTWGTQGIDWGGLAFAFYSITCFAGAFALPKLAGAMGRKATHAIALVCGSAGHIVLLGGVCLLVAAFCVAGVRDVGTGRCRKRQSSGETGTSR